MRGFTRAATSPEYSAISYSKEKAQTLNHAVRSCLALLAPIFPTTRGVRLLGLTMSGFGQTSRRSDKQLSLELIAVQPFQIAE